MKLTLAFLILLIASNSLIAQSGKGSFKAKVIKPVLNHGTVVRSVAHRTHDGRIISGVASSKANRKKYRKTHTKENIRLPANGNKIRALR